MVRRWQMLPLDHASAHLPRVRGVLHDLADAVHPGQRVPDLGPGVVMDQLTVLVYDVFAAAPAGPAAGRALAALEGLRRSL